LPLKEPSNILLLLIIGNQFTMSHEIPGSPIENQQDRKQEAIKSLIESAVQIGNDVKQYHVPEGVQFGSEYNEGEYSTHSGWVNFKEGGLMYAIYQTPEVKEKLEAAGYTRASHGVIVNNAESFHAGENSTSFKAMVEQVKNAIQMERNQDEQYLTPEAFEAKYGTPKP